MPLSRIQRPSYGSVKRPNERVNRQHKAFLRTLPCVVADRGGCRGLVTVAHLRNGTDGGTGLTPSDRYGLPLCEEHHLRHQHQHGEVTFWRNTEIPFALAERLYAVGKNRDFEQALRAIDRARVEMARYG